MLAFLDFHRVISRPFLPLVALMAGVLLLQAAVSSFCPLPVAGTRVPRESMPWSVSPHPQVSHCMLAEFCHEEEIVQDVSHPVDSGTAPFPVYNSLLPFPHPESKWTFAL